MSFQFLVCQLTCVFFFLFTSHCTCQHSKLCVLVDVHFSLGASFCVSKVKNLQKHLSNIHIEGTHLPRGRMSPYGWCLVKHEHGTPYRRTSSHSCRYVNRTRHYFYFIFLFTGYSFICLLARWRLLIGVLVVGVVGGIFRDWWGEGAWNGVGLILLFDIMVWLHGPWRKQALRTVTNGTRAYKGIWGCSLLTSSLSSKSSPPGACLFTFSSPSA